MTDTPTPACPGCGRDHSQHTVIDVNFNLDQAPWADLELVDNLDVNYQLRRVGLMAHATANRRLGIALYAEPADPADGPPVIIALPWQIFHAVISACAASPLAQAADNTS